MLLAHRIPFSPLPSESTRSFPFTTMSTSEMHEDSQVAQFKSVEVYQDVDRETFGRILKTNKPALLRGCSSGGCFRLWTLNYLKKKLGDESIVIHESDDSNLDFLSKNFRYKTCLFSEFAQQLEMRTNLHVYLRSTNRDPRSKKPARIEDDFPILSNDLQLPEFIPHNPEDELYHSSVLRIASSNVQIWTHFDLYDNILCQVQGTKRIIFFPPEDSEHLHLKGDKSLVNNLDDWQECLRQYPSIKNASPYRCLIEPGDIIFIPALWWHNIRTITANDLSQLDRGYSIGFNVFWRDQCLEKFYPERDVYGNKNLVPFEAALANLDKAINHLDKLPEKYREFYRFMLLDKLRSKLFPPSHVN